MKAIQQTAEITADRRALLLETPLPERFGTGRRRFVFGLAGQEEEEAAPAPPSGARRRKIWRGDAPWLRRPLETDAPLAPLTREEAHARHPFY